MGTYSGPPSAADGLVLYLDAANSASYSGTGNTWYDLSGNSNKATFVDSPSFQSAPQSFFNFDGSNDYMTIVRSSSMSPTSGLTQEVWFNFSTIPNAAIFIGLQYGSSYNNTYALWKDSSLLYGGVNTSGSFAAIGIGISNISGNKWHNLVHTYDGSAQRLYLDGVLLNSSNITGSIQYDANNTRVLIGADDNGGGYNTGAGYFHSGKINQIKIYNRALSASEIFQNYNASKKRYYPEENIVTNGLVLNIDPSKPSSYAGSGNTIYDLSGSGINGALINTPSFSGLNGGQINMPGSSKYIDLGQNFNFTSQNFSISYWVYLDSFTTNQAGQGPIPFFKGDYQQMGYYSQIDSNGSFGFATNQGGAIQTSSTLAGIITTSTWYHLSYVRNGTSVRLYSNGVDSTSAVASHNNPGSSNQTFKINYYKPDYLITSQMRISQFLIHNRALSAVEVQQNYNATKGRFGY